jgi:hypothetical protein
MSIATLVSTGSSETHHEGWYPVDVECLRSLGMGPRRMSIQTGHRTLVNSELEGQSRVRGTPSPERTAAGATLCGPMQAPASVQPGRDL